MNDKCEYHGCDRSKDSLDGKHCVFHAEGDKKGLTTEEYKDRFNRELNRLDSIRMPYDFEGFIFTFPIDFTGRTFEIYIDLRNARFEGQMSVEYNHPYKIQVCASFNGTKFKRSVNFEGAKFLGGAADFRFAEFAGHTTLFSDAKFVGGEALFSKSKFLSPYVEFREAKFLSKKALFDKTTFEYGPSFSGATFRCSEVIFNGAKFNKGSTDFSQTNFNCRLLNFNDVEFRGDLVNFALTTFSLDTASFSDVIFDVSELNFGSYFINGDITISNSQITGNLILDNPIITGSITFEDVFLMKKLVAFSESQILVIMNGLPLVFALFAFDSIHFKHFSKI